MRADSPLAEQIILAHSMRGGSPFFGISRIGAKAGTPKKCRLEMIPARITGGLTPVLIAGMSIKKIIGGRISA